MYPNQYCQPCQQNDCPEVEVPNPPDCVGEPCVEIVTGECVRYTGPSIPCLEITQGENLNSVIQKIAAKLCECCDDTPPPPPTCPVPTISVTAECTGEGSGANFYVSVDHVAGGEVFLEVKNNTQGGAWQAAGSVVTTGNPLDDRFIFQQPLDGSQSSAYLFRVRRDCGETQSAVSATTTVETPDCSTPTCDPASGLSATPQY